MGKSCEDSLTSDHTLHYTLESEALVVLSSSFKFGLVLGLIHWFPAVFFAFLLYCRKFFWVLSHIQEWSGVAHCSQVALSGTVFKRSRGVGDWTAHKGYPQLFELSFHLWMALLNNFAINCYFLMTPTERFHCLVRCCFLFVIIASWSLLILLFFS